jgi:hypothetical protein
MTENLCHFKLICQRDTIAERLQTATCRHMKTGAECMINVEDRLFVMDNRKT